LNIRAQLCGERLGDSRPDAESCEAIAGARVAGRKHARVGGE